MILKLRDPVSGLTHLFAALISIPGLVILVYYASVQATVWHIVSFSIFGASLILLYTASSLYHLLPISDRGINILRRIDHMMIYVLIAGTYTPICLIPLRGVWGWSILGSVWGISVAGIIMKGAWIRVPRWLSTVFYILTGWLVAIAFLPLLRTVPAQGVGWLVTGGILYSIGAIIYATKWPNISFRLFGFHEIFHVFVILGSLCHFWLMFRYILHII